MPANVKSMMYVGEKPWHGLGTYVGDREVTAAQAIEAAGLDWEVQLHPIQVLLERPRSGVGQTLAAPIPFHGRWATVALLPEGPTPLGVVKDRYLPVQNRQAFGFFDELVGEGQAIYHTAGCLGRGERVWILAKLPGTIAPATRPEDVVEKFLLLHTSHDGTVAVGLRFTPIRVVCENTLMAALAGKVDQEFQQVKIRHTMNALEKVGQARRALKLTLSWYDQLQREISALDAREFSRQAMAELANQLLPEPVLVGERSKRQETEVEKRAAGRELLVGLFSQGKGNQGRTRWDALNAVTEFVDHYLTPRSKDADARLDSVWFGRGHGLRQQALSLLSSN